MTDSDKNDDERAAMRARLDRLSLALEEKTEAARSARKTAQSGGESSAAIGKGLRIASELVAGVVVGGLAGVGLDYWLGTKPVFSILLFLLGMVAGFWNVIRDAMKPTSFN